MNHQNKSVRTNSNKNKDSFLFVYDIADGPDYFSSAMICLGLCVLFIYFIILRK